VGGIRRGRLVVRARRRRCRFGVRQGRSRGTADRRGTGHGGGLLGGNAVRPYRIASNELACYANARRAKRNRAGDQLIWIISIDLVGEWESVCVRTGCHSPSLVIDKSQAANHLDLLVIHTVIDLSGAPDQPLFLFNMHISGSIEILISDSRSISKGSQFGHTAIAIDGVVYGRAHPGWDTDSLRNYLDRQQIKMHRDTIGYVVSVSESEKQTILSEVKNRVVANRPYSIVDNNCSSNIAEVLGKAGILANDPRWQLPGIVPPADLMTGLRHSKRLIGIRRYPKK
jgi:hypothetical protein